LLFRNCKPYFPEWLTVSVSALASRGQRRRQKRGSGDFATVGLQAGRLGQHRGLMNRGMTEHGWLELSRDIPAVPLIFGRAILTWIMAGRRSVRLQAQRAVKG
jgi:hypothetical protein